MILLIVGGGPGLFAALRPPTPSQSPNHSLPSSVVNLPPSTLKKQTSDVPGFSNSTGEELTNRLIEQLNGFETCSSPQRNRSWNWEARSRIHHHNQQGSHLTKTVIIAMGGGAFNHVRIGERWGLWKYFTTTFPTSNNTLVRKWPSLVVGTQQWTGLWLFGKDCPNHSFTAERAGAWEHSASLARIIRPSRHRSFLANLSEMENTR